MAPRADPNCRDRKALPHSSCWCDGRATLYCTACLLLQCHSRLSRIIINEALGRLRKGRQTNGDGRNQRKPKFVAHVIEAVEYRRSVVCNPLKWVKHPLPLASNKSVATHADQQLTPAPHILAHTDPDTDQFLLDFGVSR
ncbi:hypothetical protein DBIPINDM_007640 (plasmid) [Mesorhizobium sp. AR02]|uniref:hypothetical protein n=1 Tax=Mesorhizobium sp. AR02 TaxID=2865837 RepID=UPI00216055E8|nr:hypothetical protein [Mesorhizobium sp. AR02]UVK49642.1 hypothetical protein DBIPINDM_007640 [Mesorhizobium sp. AR02]